MASSSLSQEDVDHDFELSSRRSRIRSARANARNTPTCRLGSAQDGDGDGTTTGMIGGVTAGLCGAFSGIGSTGLHHGNVGAIGSFSNVPGGSEGPSAISCGGPGDHDVSPKPSSRAKDKRCPRPNHVNKGKAQRERRKLREKRRSTGVVHLPSTESTGGSTGEDEDELLSMSNETKRNTAYNEAQVEKASIEASEANALKCYPVRNNKSPSDLDADDEDNQDYDSAVNQSDSAVSLLHEGGVIDLGVTRPTVNGRPETPCSENLEELLERAREENCRLLDLLKERDDRIVVLEQTVNNLTREHASI